MYKIIKVISHILAITPLVWLTYAAFNALLGGDPQEKLLHELGLWGLIFLLLSLSITPLQRSMRKVPWMKFRRMLGLYAAFYATLHLIAYLLFYLQFNFSELINEIIKRPYITIGMLGFLSLLPLVFTSTRTAQRKLGKSWKKLHRLAYFAAASGLIHFIWQSKSDLNEPLKYISWGIILLAIRVYFYLKHKRTLSISNNN